MPPRKWRLCSSSIFLVNPPEFFPPGALPLENRQAILKDLRSRGIRLTLKVTRKKPSDDEEDF